MQIASAVIRVIRGRWFGLRLYRISDTGNRMDGFQSPSHASRDGREGHEGHTTARSPLSVAPVADFARGRFGFGRKRTIKRKRKIVERMKSRTEDTEATEEFPYRQKGSQNQMPRATAAKVTKEDTDA